MSSWLKIKSMSSWLKISDPLKEICNMWPGNEGTVGGRQQTLDTKQPLLTNIRKTGADKQTE